MESVRAHEILKRAPGKQDVLRKAGISRGHGHRQGSVVCRQHLCAAVKAPVGLSSVSTPGAGPLPRAPPASARLSAEMGVYYQRHPPICPQAGSAV